MTTPKRPRDPNQLAKFIVDTVTGDGECVVHHEREAAPKKINSSKGGIKGGAARASKLSPERRVEIAQKAAKKRWGTGRVVRERSE